MYSVYRISRLTFFKDKYNFDHSIDPQLHFQEIKLWHSKIQLLKNKQKNSSEDHSNDFISVIYVPFYNIIFKPFIQTINFSTIHLNASNEKQITKELTVKFEH